MSENNLPNEGMENENTVDTEQETVETAEIYEESAEPAEEPTEEPAEEVVEEPTEEAVEDIHSSELLKIKLAKAQKAVKNLKTSATVAWILAAVLVCVDAYYFMTNIYNKYNHMGYYDIDGYTVGDVVSSMGMDFDQFKEMYGLPADMRKDTYLNAAQSLIKISKMAELNRMEFETLKENYKFGDEITEESTFGEGMDSMTIKDYLEMSGVQESFDEFKTKYNIPDSITEDMQWGKVRKTYEKQLVADREAKEKEAKSQKDDSKVTDSSDVADDSNTDTSADTSADTADDAADSNAGAADNSVAETNE